MNKTLGLVLLFLVVLAAISWNNPYAIIDSEKLTDSDFVSVSEFGDSEDPFEVDDIPPAVNPNCGPDYVYNPETDTCDLVSGQCDIEIIEDNSVVDCSEYDDSPDHCERQSAWVKYQCVGSDCANPGDTLIVYLADCSYSPFSGEGCELDLIDGSIDNIAGFDYYCKFGGTPPPGTQPASKVDNKDIYVRGEPLGGSTSASTASSTDGPGQVLDCDCGPGYKCVEIDGIIDCVPTNCNFDHECEVFGQFCSFSNTCVDCVIDEHCPDGHQCYTDNKCRECLHDLDCPGGYECVDEECKVISNPINWFIDWITSPN